MYSCSWLLFLFLILSKTHSTGATERLRQNLGRLGPFFRLIRVGEGGEKAGKERCGQDKAWLVVGENRSGGFDSQIGGVSEKG